MKRTVLAAALACLTLAASAHAAATYTVGIVPHGGLKELQEKWKPLIQWISDRSGVALKLDESVADKEESFYKKYKAGDFDFAMVNPFAYATFTKPGEYKAFARADGMLQGILVVRAGGPLKDMKDLRGKRVMFPSKHSYAATILNERDLAASGLQPDKDVEEDFAGNHMKAFTAVIDGKAEAAGGTMKTFAELKPELSEKLRILHMTHPCPPHPFVAGKRVPDEAVKKVQEALLAASSDPEARKLLKAVAMGKTVAASDAEYASLRK